MSSIIIKLLKTKTLSQVSKETGLGRTSVYMHSTGEREISKKAALAYNVAYAIPLKELLPELFSNEKE
ncbi:hypothetical protein [Maridesulfovibrio frigidus]|uniref:hypothetical protein n=1 Tax=Maridesulfovibrio frigidus TaxID=340956 RepID=UPI0004E13E5B|nr:hypothetical protein [Maridesulfovibrio frigidus]